MKQLKWTTAERIITCILRPTCVFLILQNILFMLSISCYGSHYSLLYSMKQWSTKFHMWSRKSGDNTVGSINWTENVKAMQCPPSSCFYDINVCWQSTLLKSSVIYCDTQYVISYMLLRSWCHVTKQKDFKPTPFVSEGKNSSNIESDFAQSNCFTILT